MQSVEMHAIKCDVHQTREEALDEEGAAHELAHQAADRAVLAERNERPKVAIDVRLQRLPFKAASKIPQKMCRLLLRRLCARRHAGRMTRPRTARTIADRQDVGIA